MKLRDFVQCVAERKYPAEPPPRPRVVLVLKDQQYPQTNSFWRISSRLFCNPIARLIAVQEGGELRCVKYDSESQMLSALLHMVHDEWDEVLHFTRTVLFENRRSRLLAEVSVLPEQLFRRLSDNLFKKRLIRMIETAEEPLWENALEAMYSVLQKEDVEKKQWREP